MWHSKFLVLTKLEHGNENTLHYFGIRFGKFSDFVSASKCYYFVFSFNYSNRVFLLKYNIVMNIAMTISLVIRRTSIYSLVCCWCLIIFHEGRSEYIYFYFVLQILRVKKISMFLISASICSQFVLIFETISASTFL